MKRYLLVLFLCTTLLGCGECKDDILGSLNEGVDIFRGVENVSLDMVVVSSGQSNSDGIHAYKYGYEELDNTYFFLDGLWYEDYPYKKTGPEASLVNQLAREYPFKKIGVIKYAVGGTSLELDWKIGGTLYTTLVEIIKDGKYKANVDTIDGFFWMQGESDGSNKYMAALYETNFTKFINELRDDVGSTPVVTALIGEPMKGSVAYVHTIRNAQLTVSATMDDVYVVDTYGLAKCCDNLHLTTVSQKILGELFGTTYLSVKEDI